MEEFRLYELEHTKTRNYYDFRILEFFATIMVYTCSNKW